MTPALVLRRDSLLSNLQIMQALCDEAGVRLRPHGKMHKCSTIGLLQVELGAVGLCCQTVGEAECFAAAGIGDLLVTAPVPAWGAARLAALAAAGTRLSVVADDEGQIERLQRAAHSAGAMLHVLIDVDLGLHRAGCPPQQATALARLVDQASHLSFEGVQSYLGHLQHEPDRQRRRAGNAAAAHRLRSLVEELSDVGLPPRLVTGGGTGTYADDFANGVFNELQAGSYAVMDVEYAACGAPQGEDWPFEPSLFLCASVVSARHKTHVTTDAGLKAVSVDGPPPRVVAGASGESKWRSQGDEHGAIIHPDFTALFAAASDRLTLSAEIDAIDEADSIPWPIDAPKSGALVWLQPGHCDPTINLYDTFIVADEDGALDHWRIDARRRWES
ncbi:MAG: family PLP-dependent enzyme [Sphingomonas bacterium]|nr:family PLP-dependent enzyme [Sphingomonas bacterium]